MVTSLEELHFTRATHQWHATHQASQKYKGATRMVRYALGQHAEEGFDYVKKIRIGKF